MRRITFLLASGFVLLVLQACGTPPSEPTQPAMFDKITTAGVLTQPDGATISNADLRVVTFAGAAVPAADGAFTVEMPATEKYQTQFVIEASTAAPVYIALYDPATASITADEVTTAKGLLLLNPMLMGTSQEQRSDFLTAAEESPLFEDLVQRLRAAYMADAATALSYDANPEVYQLTAELIQATLEATAIDPAITAQNVWMTPAPHIDNGDGSAIDFVSYSFVYYAAGIYPNDGERQSVVRIGPRDCLVCVELGWPPQVTFDEPVRQAHNLSDGYYRVHVTNGKWQFDRINDDSTESYAISANFGHVMLHVIELAVGEIGTLYPNAIAQLPRYLSLTPGDIYNLKNAAANGDAASFLELFMGIIETNAAAIELWFWHYTAEGGAEWAKIAASQLKNITLAFKLLGMANDLGPFLADMFLSEREATYFITIRDGELVSTQENRAPTASFTVTPGSGTIDTVFTFDASSSTDDIDTLTDLRFRWDFDGDGTWDTAWSATPTASHQYEVNDGYEARLEVRDSVGLIGTASRRINVGGGAATATVVKLFRDVLPWDSNATVTVLESLGYTQGEGELTYEIYGSDELATVPLVPGTDLVIISNDQNQTFYNRYAATQLRFSNFVNSGGSMLWGATDRGWAAGSMAAAGVRLPGNISTTYFASSWNYRVDDDLPLMRNLPDAMDHNYASHESFYNLVPGTTTYLVDEHENPTLIEYNFGAGWIIVVGLPLEHQYDRVYGANDLEQLLPRIISYFVGADWEADAAGLDRAPLATPDARPSSAPAFD